MTQQIPDTVDTSECKEFDNLDIVESYTLQEYSYYDEDGNQIDLVKVYILKNQNDEYLYHIDEPTLTSNKVGSDNIELTEREWYNMVKHRLNKQLSHIDDKVDVIKNITDLQTRSCDLWLILENIKAKDFEKINFNQNIEVEDFDKITFNRAFRLLKILFGSIIGKDITINDLPEIIPKETRIKIKYNLQQNYFAYGKIDPLMNDKYISEINCVGEGNILLQHENYGDMKINNIEYNATELEDMMNLLANKCGEYLHERNAMIDESLPDGSCVQLRSKKHKDISEDSFTIRKDM